MGLYDARGLMLDPGLTALALRGLHDRDGHYPFIDRVRSRRPSKVRTSRRHAIDAASRWQRTLRWCGLRRGSIVPV